MFNLLDTLDSIVIIIRIEPQNSKFKLDRISFKFHYKIIFKIFLNGKTIYSYAEVKIINPYSLTDCSIHLLKIATSHRTEGSISILQHSTIHHIFVLFFKFDQASYTMVYNLVTPGLRLFIVKVQRLIYRFVSIIIYQNLYCVLFGIFKFDF